jgi:hypothetical protein
MTLSGQPSEQAVGEIIESSTLQFGVACYRLYEAPAFGALVKASRPGQSGWVYSVVYDVNTGSDPPGAQVTVRGRGGLRDEAIYIAYPDLPEIMCTRFTALTVGFSEGGAIRQYLPPHPPPLHYSVYVCSAAEVCAFTEQLGYLRTILTNQEIPADELTAASVRQARACRPDDPQFALRAGRLLAQVLKEEYDRLRAILSRLDL